MFDAAIPGYSNALPNTVYYRASTSPSDADTVRIAADIAASMPAEAPFTPSFVAVFTWFAVGPSSNRSDVLDTFQATLASDVGGRSFVTLW